MRVGDLLISGSDVYIVYSQEYEGEFEADSYGVWWGGGGRPIWE